MNSKVNDSIIISFETTNGYEILQGDQPDAFFDKTIASNFEKWKSVCRNINRWKGLENVS